MSATQRTINDTVLKVLESLQDFMNFGRAHGGLIEFLLVTYCILILFYGSASPLTLYGYEMGVRSRRNGGGVVETTAV